MARKKNSTTIIGRKLSILPTPAKTPSMTRLCTTGLSPYAVRDTSTISVSLPMPSASRSESHFPRTLKVIQNIKPIIAINVGMARYLFVSTLSILTLRSISLLSCAFTTHSEHTASINRYRISARAALRSSPPSVSISKTA